MNTPRLICKTTIKVVTQEGDFVPIGTLVDVLSWDENTREILCRCHAYMFAGDNPDDLTGWNGNVGDEIYISVTPDSLQYINLIK